MPSERKLTLIRVAVVGAFAALGILVVTGLRDSGDSASDGVLGPLSDARAATGSPAPPFRLANADGGTIELAALKGKPVVVNFWATWCGPCKTEMPLIQEAFAEAGGQLEVLGVNYQESAEAAKSYRDEMHLTFPIVLDSDGKVADAYFAQGLPVTYFIDSEGVVKDFRIGGVDAALLEDKLAAIGVTADVGG